MSSRPRMARHSQHNVPQRCGLRVRVLVRRNYPTAGMRLRSRSPHVGGLSLMRMGQATRPTWRLYPETPRPHPATTQHSAVLQKALDVLACLGMKQRLSRSCRLKREPVTAAIAAKPCRAETCEEHAKFGRSLEHTTPYGTESPKLGISHPYWFRSGAKVLALDHDCPSVTWKVQVHHKEEPRGGRPRDDQVMLRRERAIVLDGVSPP